MCGLVGHQILADGSGACWLATMDQQPAERTGRMSGFRTWWRTDVTRDARDELWSREGHVIVVANQDGGAHVDPRLDERYHALTRENAMGWRFHRAGAGPDNEGLPFLNSPVLASIRQIAWEVEWTLRLFLWKELGLDGPEAHRSRPPDPEQLDDRGQSGQLGQLPSISFRMPISGGPFGRTYKLRHPPGMVVTVRRERPDVAESLIAL